MGPTVKSGSQQLKKIKPFIKDAKAKLQGLAAYLEMLQATSPVG
jgi:hypothetical protein